MVAGLWSKLPPHARAAVEAQQRVGAAHAEFAASASQVAQEVTAPSLSLPLSLLLGISLYRSFCFSMQAETSLSEMVAFVDEIKQRVSPARLSFSHPFVTSLRVVQPFQCSL